jgi:hypothetical protein
MPEVKYQLSAEELERIRRDFFVDDLGPSSAEMCRLIDECHTAIRLREERRALAKHWATTESFARGFLDDELCIALDSIAAEAGSGEGT